jgi:hypothetical protein
MIFATGRLNTSGTRLQATLSVCAAAAAWACRADGHAKSKFKIA